MSRRSPNGRRRKTAQGEGASAPYTRQELEDAMAQIGKRFAALEARFESPHHTKSPVDLESSLVPRNALTTRAPPAPCIKPRLEDLINRLTMLAEKLDHIDYIVAGGDLGLAPNAGSGGAAMASPHSIPEMLSVIESLLTRAQGRAMELGDRF